MPTYSQEWDPGDYRANNEQRGRMGFGGTEHGGEQYASRSRMLGSEAQQRGAYQSDFGQSNESRGLGMDARNDQNRAAGLIESAAMGKQPSAAEVLARRNNEAAIRAGTSMAAGVKGGAGARVAAMRNAQRMGSQQMAQGAQQAEQLRAQEMADARGQLMGARTAIRQGDTAQRGQDLGAAQIQQQNELTQRGLNDQQQRFFEQQGFNTQVQDQNNQLAQQGLATGAWQAGRAATQEDEKFDFGKTMTYAKAGASAVGGAASGAADYATSDERAKNIIPFGSLAPMTTSSAPASADALSGSGGMDVMGTLKANSKFATKYQRDPTGGMTSDERAKNIMYSPAEIKDPVQYVDAQRKAGAYASPDMTPIPAYGSAEKKPPPEPASFLASEQGGEESGTYRPSQESGITVPIAGGEAWAPRGYAAAREGHAGAMFGNSPEVTSGYEKKEASAGAPGTEDFKKYGEPAKKDGEVDWKHGGTTTDKGKKPNAILGSLAGFLGGLSGRDSAGSRDVMYSDDKTKLAAAFEAGKASAKPELGGKIKDAVKNASGEDAKKLHDVAIQAGGHLAMSPAAAPNVLVDKATDQLKATTEAKPEEARQAFIMPRPVADATLTTALGPVGAYAVKKVTTSDEKAKKVIDLDEGDDKSRMRDGSSDPRTNSFDKTFRRDTKADQARVKKGVEDKAGKDADAMMAGFGASLKKGPTARVEDIDSDEKPDLSYAAKEKGNAGHIPEHAMFRAMKAMEPSLYSYKPEFKPPEQSVGEVQAGPMANNMQRDPIAGTAIVKDPGTGLLAIDKDKALKLTMGSLAVLAQDVEQMKRKKKGAR